MAPSLQLSHRTGTAVPVVLLFGALLALVLTCLSIPADAYADETEQRFSWPLSPAPQVTQPFGAPDQPYGPGHYGADLSATLGQDVLAAAEGVVVFAGPVAGRGVVSIDHSGGLSGPLTGRTTGLRTTYEPVRPLVAAGERVAQGQVVGTVVSGHRGCGAQVCLHWGVRRGVEYLDPLRLVHRHIVIRLKPWNG